MKKFIILVGRHGRPSTKELFKKLTRQNCEHVIKSSVFEGYVVRTDPRNLNIKRKVRNTDAYDCRGAIVLRWGWYGNVITDSQTIMYNGADAIKAANDKGQCRKLLAEKGVAVPKTYLLNEIRNGIQLTYPLIARPSHHGRGRNLWVCNNRTELDTSIRRGAAYFSEIYPKTEEYRVHCVLGKIVEVMKKPAPADINQVAWNRAQNDQPFTRVPWADWKNYICKLALDAAKALNLQFAGVDIMVQRTNTNLPKAVVCEVNTAPTLTSSPHVQERYGRLFNKIANSDSRIEPWDYNQFEVASSLAWKEDQF